MAQQIQLRRGTAAQWAAENPILGQGEPGYESDTGVLKIGDGTTAYNSLTAYSTGTGVFLPLAGGTMTGRLTLNAVREDVHALGDIASGGTVTIDPTNGSIQHANISAGPVTIAWHANFLDGDSVLLRFFGVVAVTWPASVQFKDGEVPTLAPDYTVISVWRESNTFWVAPVGSFATV